MPVVVKKMDISIVVERAGESKVLKFVLKLGYFNLHMKKILCCFASLRSLFKVMVSLYI